MLGLLLAFHIRSHTGGERLIQQRLVVFFGHAVVARQFRHLLFADRYRVHLASIRVDLCGNVFLFFAQAFRLAINYL